MSKYLIILIVILGLSCYYLIERNKQLRVDYNTAIENVKAYSQSISNLEQDNRVFKLTIEQLNYYSDSILLKMQKVQKELNIKNREISQMQYLLSTNSRTDTITLVDTIFRDNTIHIDTIISDKWYSCRVGLHYPSIITVSPTFINEQYVVVHSKRETVKPPKKFFLARWFQRRHTIGIVDVCQKSPYAKIQQQRFIEIIK